MDYEYSIDEESGIICQTFAGRCSFENLEAVLVQLCQDPRFDPDYDILTDLHACEFELGLEQVELFAQLFMDMFKESKGKSALLVDSPRETATSMIFQDMVTQARWVEVFSTREAALNWVRRKS